MGWLHGFSHYRHMLITSELRKQNQEDREFEDNLDNIVN